MSIDMNEMSISKDNMTKTWMAVTWLLYRYDSNICNTVEWLSNGIKDRMCVYTCMSNQGPGPVSRARPQGISYNIPNKIWDEIMYLFPNFNGATVEVCERVNTFTPQFIVDVITYPC